MFLTEEILTMIERAKKLVETTTPENDTQFEQMADAARYLRAALALMDRHPNT